MKISEVSDKTNISIHTLRYYEKEGLLLNIQRDSSGQRTFDHADLEWLTWIKRLKSTGMPLAEIKNLQNYVWPALRHCVIGNSYC
ncbi:MerR family transcriptional regulator [Vibrio vulnificus]|uniref:MerR family transcriptional regulator n=1 Tax=Vibrio vulnificus TaxID=672 RepID=UPI001EEBAA44|nr:MerR family transcriptional regulator [Vibrio vulnificus]